MDPERSPFSTLRERGESCRKGEKERGLGLFYLRKERFRPVLDSSPLSRS